MEATAGATIVPAWAHGLRPALIWKRYSDDPLAKRIVILQTEPRPVEALGFEKEEGEQLEQYTIYYFTGYPKFVQVETTFSEYVGWYSAYVSEPEVGEYTRLSLCENLEGDEGYDEAHRLAVETAIAIIKSYEEETARGGMLARPKVYGDVDRHSNGPPRDRLPSFL